MEITWKDLLARIQDDPLAHLGGLSPELLYPYVNGYDHALRIHSKNGIRGEQGLWDFNRWFMSHAYRGPQGWASYCVLLTDTDEEALDLFFEFYGLFIKSDWKKEDPTPTADRDIAMSMLDLLKSDAVRTRPAMYFGNDLWLRSLWAMWNGYIWAEKDASVESSPDNEVFVGFQEWINQRFEFTRGANWGKVFDFLALNHKEKALENFFDHFDLYLEGAPPDARTSRFQTWLDEALANALKE